MDYRFSEKVFRRFEQRLKEATHRLPGVAVFDPRPFAATTFSRRLRDAKTSILTYGWKSDVDIAKLSAYDMVISEQDGKVLTGTMEALAQYKQHKVAEVGSLVEQGIQPLRMLKLKSTEKRVIEAAVILHQHGEIDTIELPLDADYEELADRYELLYEIQTDKVLVI